MGRWQQSGLYGYENGAAFRRELWAYAAAVAVAGTILFGFLLAAGKHAANTS